MRAYSVMDPVSEPWDSRVDSGLSLTGTSFSPRNHTTENGIFVSWEKFQENKVW